MPLVKVIRKGITPAIRKILAVKSLAVMPMTLERIAHDATSEDEEPLKVESERDAFEQFQPNLDFAGRAGEEETEFKASLRFRNIRDFHPQNLQRRQEIKNEAGEFEYLRNDIADLRSTIDLLYRLKDRWKLPAVRRAWADPEKRREIITALENLRTELEKVAARGKG